MCIRDRLKIAEQVLINKRSRESAEKQRLNIKKKLLSLIHISIRRLIYFFVFILPRLLSYPIC